MTEGDNGTLIYRGGGQRLELNGVTILNAPASNEKYLVRGLFMGELGPRIYTN